MAEIKSYDPSLRDRLAWFLSDMAGDNRTARNYINDKARGIMDFVPGVGDAVAVDEAGRTLSSGNYGQGILEAGLAGAGLIPGFGDGVAKVGKGLLRKGLGNTDKVYMPKGLDISDVPEWVEGYHGTRNPGRFDVPKSGVENKSGGMSDSGLHLTTNPDVAQFYATSAHSNIGDPRYRGGRVYPVFADPGETLDGLPDFIQWNNQHVASGEARKFLKGPSASGLQDDTGAVLESVARGMLPAEAIQEAGYNSARYMHNDPDMPPSEAYALFGNRAVIPKFSEEGLYIKNSGRFRPASIKLEDPDKNIDWFSEFLRSGR